MKYKNRNDPTTGPVWHSEARKAEKEPTGAAIFKFLLDQNTGKIYFDRSQKVTAF